VHVLGRSEEALAELRKAFAAVKGSWAWDLRDEGKAEAYQRYLTDNRIRTVVSTVGVGIGNPLPLLSQSELGAMVEANLVSPFMILKHSLVPLKQQGGGRIIVFGSITSIIAQEGASGYSASKMAIRGLLEAARRELRNGFQMISLHGVYTGSVERIKMSSAVEAVRYLARLHCGVHADVIVN
jgi:short-subunit dehydrogenase